MNTLFISSFPAAPPASQGATATQLGDWVFLPDTIETYTLAVHWCAPLNHPQGGVAAIAAELVHDAEFKIYARGTIRHPDHDAIQLAGWHRVFLRDNRRPPHCGAPHEPRVITPSTNLII